MNGIKVFYLRNEKEQPVACVATLIDGKDIRYAVSTRNPQDSYKKEIARSLALGRVFQEYKSPEFGGVVEGGPGAKHRIIAEIANSVYMPLRTRKAAALWLEYGSGFVYEFIPEPNLA